MASGNWELVEMAEQRQDEEEVEECEGEETKISFFHQTIDDFAAVGVISPGKDDPLLRFDVYKKFNIQKKKKKKKEGHCRGGRGLVWKEF